MTFFTDFITKHPQISLIILIILLFLILIIFVVPFIFKLIGMRKNNKETSALKKDLMIWRRIANLARGGSDAERSKRFLVKGQIELLRESFNNGLLMVKEAYGGLYEVPWYVCIGEPSSGKSVFMNSSELDMVFSENESLDSDSSQKTSPLRFWMGSQSVVLEVGGKPFFDRWFGGSSPEFGEIIKLLRSKHKKKPISGIILTIPADALIADNSELCKKKATLIAAEFHKLVTKLSMRLPCYVVVTKLDVATGFRDYFSELDENMRSKIFGWTSELSGNGYDKTIFGNFWEETLKSLRKGRNTLLLSRLATDKRGSETAANLFMFPESFNALYPNLEVYLKTIFGMRKIMGLENIKLEGVYFTSGKDGGISFDRSFAELKGKPIDDVPLNYGTKILKSYFITDLLSNRIFPENSFAGYTDKALAKGYVPYYFLTFFSMALGIFWGASALFTSGNVSKIMNSELSYYKRMEILLTGRLLDRSPLISADKDGQGVLLFNDPMVSDPGIKRIDFFSGAHNQALTLWKAPLGFRLSSAIKYGNNNMAYTERQFIFDKVQTRMLFLPLLYAIENNFQRTIDEPVTGHKREAILQLLKIAASREKLGAELLPYKPLYQQDTIDAFLLYMFPGMTQEIRDVLKTYYPKFQRNALNVNSEILLSPAYAKGSYAGIKSLISGWESFINYPESAYSLQKNLIEYGTETERLFTKYEFFEPIALDPYDIGPLEANIKEWISFCGRERIAANKVTDAMSKILAYYYKGKNIKEINDKIDISMLLPAAYLDYEKRFLEDIDMLEIYGRRTIKGADGYNIYRVPLGTAYLAKVRDGVLKNLKIDYATLKKKIDIIESNPFFKTDGNSADNETSGNNISNYAIMGDMLKLAVIPEYKIQNIDGINFEKEWEQNELLIASQMEAFDNYTKRHMDNYFVESLAPISKKMLGMQASYIRINLVNLFLSSLPTSSTQLIADINSLESPGGKNDLFVKNLEGTVPGKIAFQSEFNPRALELYIKPFGFMRKFLTKQNNGSYEYEYFNVNQRYGAITRVMDGYSERFIRYWAGFGDSLVPNIYNYSSFHNLVNSAKAYVINSMLYSVYDRSYEILAGLNDEYIAPSAAEERANAIATLEARRKIIDANFSENCSKLMDSWSSLSISALEANKIIMSMPERRIKSEFLALKGAPDNIASIPWWNKLFNNGVQFLKSDASLEASNIIKRYRMHFGRFPLLKDGSPYKALSKSELETINGAFRQFTWFVEENNEKQETVENKTLEIKEPLNLGNIVRNENTVKKWGSGILKILDSLVGGSAPLEWSLVIPDSIVQSKLVSQYGSNRQAIARFRYANIKYSSAKTSGRFPTSAAHNKEIIPVTYDASVNDISLSFYTYSDSKKPEAKVSIPGSWAILSLYLQDGCVKNTEKGIYYAPLKLTDSMGAGYIFYIGIKFSKQIPEPNEWPLGESLPEFIY